TVLAAAILLARNSHPAANPAAGFRTRYPYSYVPPANGYAVASWAEERAFAVAATPARRSPARNAGPAIPAAIPVTTKMPAPMIAPKPIPTASRRPSSRRSPGAGESAPVVRPRGRLGRLPDAPVLTLRHQQRAELPLAAPDLRESYLSPRLPTEGSIPASASRSV